jgi:uncharacterized damage-inducible protein DinB
MEIKEQLTKYAEYNLWANSRIAEVLSSAPDDVWLIEQKSSFTTLRATALHIYGAETIWLSRLTDNSILKLPGSDFKGTNREVLQLWQNASKNFVKFISDNSGEYFDSSCTFSNLKGEKFTIKVSDIIQHCFNHSTFHRGQIVTMLRFAGITELPSTDYITYIRQLGE